MTYDPMDTTRSWRTYGRAPSLETFWDEELNLGRVPADEAVIAATEARLRIRLPAWLRQLYARYDGGAVRMAQMELAEPDDWHKTEPLIPRARLLGAGELFSFAEVRLREEYRDDAYADLAAGGDDARLIAVATDDWSPGRALCLDYSGVEGEGEPEIVLVLTGEGERRRLAFEGIDELLTRLVHVQYWSPALQSVHEPDRKSEAYDPRPPTLETFWRGPGFWSDATGEPASEALIAATEVRLGARLPALLKALYRRQDGGYTHFEWAPLRRNPSDNAYDWESVVPDRYISSLGHLRTLADVASDFQAGTEAHSFARTHARCEWIVVLALHGINWTLCLDYRARGPQAEPEVLYFEYFDDLVPIYRARSFDQFFGDLRKELD